MCFYTMPVENIRLNNVKVRPEQSHFFIGLMFVEPGRYHLYKNS